MTVEDMRNGKCSICDGVSFEKSGRCRDCHAKQSCARKAAKVKRLVENPKDEVCKTCGENRWDNYGRCLTCKGRRENKRRDKVREEFRETPKDEICEICGTNTWGTLGECRFCTNEKHREYVLKEDRPCPDCDGFCAVGEGYCNNCRSRRRKDVLDNSDERCSGYERECDNERATGSYYCKDCNKIKRDKRLARDDRKCPRCDNLAIVGSDYCLDCRREKHQERMLQGDRICGDCGDFCKIGGGYCKECSYQRQKKYLNRDDRQCKGFNGECNNMCKVGHWYCVSCIKARDQTRRATLRNAEGTHGGKERDLLFDLFGNICLACLLNNNNDNDEILHGDHAQSLHNGGSNGIYNLQPLCQYHNLSKRAKNIRYIENALYVLDIPLVKYFEIIDLSHEDYGYLLDWWDKLEVNEHKRFDW